MHRIQAQQRLIEEYTQLAPDYDRRWQGYVAGSHGGVLESLKQLPALHTVLDIGAGTGLLLHAIHQKYPKTQLYGVEPIRAMLHQAQQRLPKTIQLAQAWAENIPFADATMDVVVSSSAFHYFAEPQQALQEMHRVLRPQGRVILVDWTRDFLSMRLLAYYLRLRNRVYERMYNKKEFITMLHETGFHVESAHSYKLNSLWGLIRLEAVKHV